ncbi:MAG: hypothetical protein JWO38_5424 [Gemmataceae bacterium]|nr:hypothetical protein [Gemmataceae bacterium]
MSRPFLPFVILICSPLTSLANDPLSVTLPDVAPAADGADALRDARTLFKQGKYVEAEAKFAASRGQAQFTEGETAAWAYCRVRVAADAVNKPTCDAATAAAVEKNVTEAIQLAPNNAGLQKIGQAVLAVARQRKAGPGRQPGVAANPAGGGSAAPTPAVPIPAGWDVIDMPSFRVTYKGTKAVAETVARAAETKREEIFKRWSGPPGGAWSPRCEIVLHPTAESYATMTGKPAEGAGHATVRLADGRATERRIDLRADDDGVVANTLPRDLTHVVLADLFPHTPPPKWAEEGMAVLAASPEEVGRYTQTLPRCRRTGELFTVPVLMEMKEFPAADKITGFYCGSVSLVDYLVRLKGEKHFNTFLRDCQRYGSAQALKRQYDIDGPKALQDAWLRAMSQVVRGQAP